MQLSSDKIDDDSKKALQEVKKGKVRKFVMIKEGVQIDRLYVFKKGPHEKFVRLAKQDGVRGQAFWGVVRGDGLDIFFELSRADGFENPPGKDIRLKEFIKEETGFKFEPAYAIVDTLTTVDETDEEEAQADTQPDVDQAAEETAVTQAIAKADAAKTDEEQGDKFTRLLKKILPHVKRALATASTQGDELRKHVREAQDMGRRREFEQGLATLRTLGELAKKVLTEKGSASANSAANPTAKFAERLQELCGQIEDAHAGDTSFAHDITRRLRDAETLAGRQKFDRASAALQQLERLLDLARAETARRQQWEERFTDLEPRYNGAVDSGVQDSRTLQAIMGYAKGQADRKQYVKALIGLDRIEQYLGASA